MKTSNLKPWYKSKTIWIGVAMLLHVISNYIMHGTLTQADIMEGFTALGFFGLRDAVGLLHARKK